MKISYILALFFLLSVFNADASEFIGIPTPVDPAPDMVKVAPLITLSVVHSGNVRVMSPLPAVAVL